MVIMMPIIIAVIIFALVVLLLCLLPRRELHTKDIEIKTRVIKTDELEQMERRIRGEIAELRREVAELGHRNTVIPNIDSRINNALYQYHNDGRFNP